jgi:F-type H+-transporting ATPase subunit b
MNERRIPTLWASAALVLALSFGPALGAQEHPPAPAHEAAAPATGHGTEAHASEGHAAEPQAAEGHEAHATGAAHEGAGHEGAAHHTEIKLFGVSLGTVAQFGVKLFNFAIFAAILGFLLKGVLASAFKARAQELQDKLSQAERDKAEAETQIRDLEARMAGLQQELEGIMAKAETDAEAEKERILESAKQEAAQILAQTGAEIDFQRAKAEAELRSLVAELAIKGATERLETRLQGGVAATVLDQAIAQVGGAK